MTTPDVLVVGSGPSAVCAARVCVDRGLDVHMLDVGHDDTTYRPIVPDQPFSVIRRTDPAQHRYFLGDRLEGLPEGSVRVGAQLTPPRQFIVEKSDEQLPYESRDFFPMQSLALGGLGAGWGAQTLTYSDEELRRAGLPPDDLRRHYPRVVEVVGVSAATDDDIAPDTLEGIGSPQPPLDLDSGATRLLEAYRRIAPRLHASGFRMGRTPLAVLSRDLADRRANPYHDMDFWSESRRSIFRPRYLVESLRSEPGFRYTPDRLVTRFESAEGGAVRVTAWNVRTGSWERFEAHRLFLGAGAINSARIVLRSAKSPRAVPILCNRYAYVPTVQWRMLGRAADDRRHSLSQLCAVWDPQRCCDSAITCHFYGYRSLLLFKLVKEMPLPPWAGLRVARLLVNSLMIVGIHHPDAAEGEKSLRLVSDAPPTGKLAITYEDTPERRSAQDRMERRLLKILRRLGCLPTCRIDPGKASSIHYAGTLPVVPPEGGDGWTRIDGRLVDFPNVFVGDSSAWRFLPSKGPTLTIMANAMRVAHALADDLAR